MSGDDTIEAALRKALEADRKLAAEKAEPSAEAAAPRARVDALNAAPAPPGEPTLDGLRERVATNAMKRVSVICLQCGLSVDRIIDAETAQTKIHPISIARNWNAPSKGRDAGTRLCGAACLVLHPATMPPTNSLAAPPRCRRW
jgi:hypothetical protein